MRQVVIPRIGGPEVLELRELADPEPAAGEIRIRVAASGVNFADVMARVGLYPDAPPLPACVGYEVAGTVDRIGAGVERVAVGDRVVALTRFGGYADTVVIPAGQAARVPAGLELVAAAAVPVNYLTAYLMLVELGALAAHHSVLVHSAAGGVGQAALQICRQRGATVIGSASAGKHARLRERGVAVCVDSAAGDAALEQAVREATGGRGVDIVLDAQGGRSFRTSYRLLAPTGRLFMFGVASFAPGRTRSLLAAVRGLVGMPRFSPISMMNDNRGVFGINLGHLWDETAMLDRAFAEILARCDDGTYAPVVDRTFPLAEAGAAHAALQSRATFGKIVLTM